MSAAGWITAIGVVVVLVVLFGVFAVRRDKADEQRRVDAFLTEHGGERGRHATGGSIVSPPGRPDGEPVLLSEGGPVDDLREGGYVSPDLRSERRTHRSAGAPTGGARRRAARRRDDDAELGAAGFAGGLFDPVTPADTTGREPGGWTSEPGPASDSGGSSGSDSSSGGSDSGGGSW